MAMAIDTKVTEEEIRKVYAEVVRGNVLSIVHRPSNRVVLQVVIYPQGDMQSRIDSTWILQSVC